LTRAEMESFYDSLGMSGRIRNNERDRSIFFDRFLEQQTYSAISRKYSITPARVKQIIDRDCYKLRYPPRRWALQKSPMLDDLTCLQSHMGWERNAEGGWIYVR